MQSSIPDAPFLIDSPRKIWARGARVELTLAKATTTQPYKSFLCWMFAYTAPSAKHPSITSTNTGASEKCFDDNVGLCFIAQLPKSQSCIKRLSA